MNSILRTTAMAFAVAGAMAAGSAAATDRLTTEKDRISYMVGMDIAGSLDPIKDEIDVAVMARAIETVLAGRQPLLNEEQVANTRAAFMQKLQTKHADAAQKSRLEGEAFLEANRGKPGVQVTASGLQYQVITAGNGDRPAATDTVRVHYAGTLLDGTTFDSSYDRNEPATFPLNRVIPGWTEGVQLMPVGSKYKFWIPFQLAYGESGQGPIPPNAMLTFEVELLEIVR